jgi:hypothetical protein
MANRRLKAHPLPPFALPKLEQLLTQREAVSNDCGVVVACGILGLRCPTVNLETSAQVPDII